jgi:hypothetical protein
MYCKEKIRLNSEFVWKLIRRCKTVDYDSNPPSGSLYAGYSNKKAPIRIQEPPLTNRSDENQLQQNHKSDTIAIATRSLSP